MDAGCRDIGIALRDFLEGQTTSVFRLNADGELLEHKDQRKIEFIDVSDPITPIFYMDNGQMFAAQIMPVRMEIPYRAKN